MEKEVIYQRLNEVYFGEDCDEKDTLSFLTSYVARSRCFIDVGASLGQYTKFANEQMDNGRIFTIEADPIRFEELERNCKKWAQESSNSLHPIHAAVSDVTGTATFHTTESTVSGGLFAHPTKSEVEWKRIEVPSLTLDDYFLDETPDFVKMDVEGSELRALRGARKLLEQKRTAFFIEIHSWPDPDGQKDQHEVFDFMEAGGYSLRRFQGRNLFVPSRG